MKLYCVKFKDSNHQIIDVQHIFANDNKEAHSRLDYFLEMCKENHIKDYYSYAFFEVQTVDGLNLNIWFDNYKIQDNKTKLIKT